MKIGIAIFILSFQAWSQQRLYVGPGVDIKKLDESFQTQLAGTVLLKELSSREIRNELIEICQIYLEKKVGSEEFGRNLDSWAQLGFTEGEREIIMDTFRKSEQVYKRQKEWSCRLRPSEKCFRTTFEKDRLPIPLKDYEGVLIDGIPYPSQTWDRIQLTDAKFSWVFVSSKYKTFRFFGTWPELQSQIVSIEPLVFGSCENPQAANEIQSLQNLVYYQNDCIRPSLPASSPEPSFYARHKKEIWWTVGIVIGAGVLHSFQGKSLVIDKPGFM